MDTLANNVQYNLYDFNAIELHRFYHYLCAFMKIVIHIFTLYMLTLSLIPCSDGDGGIVELTKQFFGVEHQHISDHDKHSNGCGDDTCSPFCVCNCCSISVNVPANINFHDKHIMLVSKKLPSYKSDFYPSVFLTSVWHPPTFS